MKFYAVAKWDYYYPVPNNVQKVFTDEEDAIAFLEHIRQQDRNERNEYDRYEIFVYEV